MNQTEIIQSQLAERTGFNAASARFAPDTRLGSDTVAALIHDARNLLTALNLYSDLLSEPGVLAPAFSHYGNELRMIAAAGRGLVSKLLPNAGFEPPRVSFEGRDWGAAAASCEVPGEFYSGGLPSRPRAITGQREMERIDDEFAASPIANLAAELLAGRNLLAALAGPGIAVTVDVEGGARGIQLTAEDLTRILVNLVRNSVDAMAQSSAVSGGRIHIGLTELGPSGTGSSSGIGSSEIGSARPSASDWVPACLRLVFEDNGPGISPDLIDNVFDRGFTTHTESLECDNWIAVHRGLGLAITRSIIESAGGRIQVSNRPGGGARFSIELPAL